MRPSTKISAMPMNARQVTRVRAAQRLPMGGAVVGLLLGLVLLALAGSGVF